MPYYVMAPVTVGEEVIGWEKKRRAAASSLSAEDAIAKAIRLEREGKEAEELWWKVQRGEVVLNPVPTVVEAQEEPSPIRMNLIDCANQMMSLRKRYVGKKVEGHRHSYKEKQANYINHLTVSGLAERTMDRLTLAEIATWFVSFMETHAETTSARYKAWLVQVGGWAASNGYWKANLFTQLPELVASVSEASKRIYTFAEIDAMWDACTTPQQRAELVLLRLGLRQGEMLALDESMLGDHHLEIKYTLGEAENVWSDLSTRGVQTKNVPYLGRPKTPGSCGTVYVPRMWMAHIKEALRASRWSGVRAYDDVDGKMVPRRFVVSNRFGLAWEEGSASKSLRNLMERAGVPVGDNDSTNHAWRHTFCSDLCALGANDITLSYLMRHRDANLSKTVYAAARKDDLQVFRRYAQGIDSITDYIDAIARMDEDRRAAKRAT